MLSLFSLVCLTLSVSFVNSQTATCLAPNPGNPTAYTFYITFHANIPNMYHYDKNGQFLGPVFPNTNGVSELRGMLMFDNGNMVVANANSSDSKLLLGTECGVATVSVLSPHDLSHPYGVAAGVNPSLTEGYPSGTTVVYATSQNSLLVSYYVLDETLSVVQKYGYFGPSNFFLKIRGAAVNPLTQELIVADEGANTTYFLDNNGMVSRTIKLSNPIGTYVADNILYVSSNDDSLPAVYAYSLTDSLKLVATYQTPNLMDFSHPCGISSCGDDLLVLSQDNRSLLVFSKSTTKYLRTIINDFGDDPEQIIVLNCQSY